MGFRSVVAGADGGLAGWIALITEDFIEFFLVVVLFN